VSTLISMTEVPKGEFVEHLDEFLRRVAAGEEIVVTVDGKPIVHVAPHGRVPQPRRSVGWDEFWSWPKADRGMLEVLREIRTETTNDWADPWERYGAGR
jgi:antitoxin (DNA-binding transcriptional repressor) of toxin-antitoxin stability system